MLGKARHQNFGFIFPRVEPLFKKFGFDRKAAESKIGPYLYQENFTSKEYEELVEEALKKARENFGCVYVYLDSRDNSNLLMLRALKQEKFFIDNRSLVIEQAV